MRLTRKNSKFEWGREEVEALKSIVEDIVNNAISLPDYDAMNDPDITKRRPAVLCVDASNVGIGAWLGQRDMAL